MIHCKKKFPKSSPSVLRGTLALNLLARGHFHPAEGAVTLSSLSNRRHRFSELLKGLWTQRTAPSRPRSRGTFRKTRSRKWALPRRGLWGDAVTRGEFLLQPEAQAPPPSSSVLRSRGLKTQNQGQVWLVLRLHWVLVAVCGIFSSGK